MTSQLVSWLKGGLRWASRQPLPSDTKQYTASDEEFVQQTFESLLGRRPTGDELMYGINQLRSRPESREYVWELLQSPEASFARKARAEAPQFVPPGHYYSPIINVAEFTASRQLHARCSSFAEVAHDPERQLVCFRELAAYFDRIAFPVKPTAGFRYYFENDFFSYGDALILAAMIQKMQPRRIIEVGSGFSSALILDTLDHMTGNATQCTFIEPYPERLKSLLRPDDYDRTTIIEKAVQVVPLKIFAELEANDILFLDTTHVLKTGSDVNHELFNVLPILKSGVIIHFHDVFDGFEYPDTWVIGDNRSWNELYALRAFLMYNDAYSILLMNNAVASSFPDEVRAASPNFMKNSGGGLYLQKR